MKAEEFAAGINLVAQSMSGLPASSAMTLDAVQERLTAAIESQREDDRYDSPWVGERYGNMLNVDGELDVRRLAMAVLGLDSTDVYVEGEPAPGTFYSTLGALDPLVGTPKPLSPDAVPTKE